MYYKKDHSKKNNVFSLKKVFKMLGPWFSTLTKDQKSDEVGLVKVKYKVK